MGQNAMTVRCIICDLNSQTFKTCCARVPYDRNVLKAYMTLLRVCKSENWIKNATFSSWFFLNISLKLSPQGSHPAKKKPSFWILSTGGMWQVHYVKVPFIYIFWLYFPDILTHMYMRRIRQNRKTKLLLLNLYPVYIGFYWSLKMYLLCWEWPCVKKLEWVIICQMIADT